MSAKKDTEKPEKAEKVSSKKGKFSRAKLLFIASSTSLLLILGFFVGYAFYYQNRILPHTYIGGVSVGGLTQAQAEETLVTAEKQFLATPLVLTYEAKEWKIAPGDLGFVFNHKLALQQAIVAHSGTGEQIQELALAVLRSRRFSSDLSPLTEAGKSTLRTKVLSDIEVAVHETSLTYAANKVTLVEGKSGRGLDFNQFEAQTYEQFAQKKSSLSLSLITVNPEITTELAEVERKRAEAFLTSAWKLSASDQTFNLEAADLASWLSSSVSRDLEGKALGLTTVVNLEKAKAYLATIAPKLAKPATNARIKGENGQISIQEEARLGVQLDTEASLKTIQEAINATSPPTYQLALSTSVQLADLRKDTIASLGVKELIGSATTDFTGSPANRKFNIGVGQRALNGGLLKDGETYSTTGTLGPVDESTGYLPELVIKNNRTVPEAGGGLCQVSTTLFRAVLNAGLPVLERTNHAYRVGYYERGVGPGLDATVYIPNPDFKWKNDTGHAVYIQSFIVNNTITFELYGTKDGRTSTISTPQILEVLPVGQPIYSDTDTLFKGEQRQVETAHDGAVTSVDYRVMRGGAEIYHKEFKSHYKPWPAQFLVGTKDRPV